MFRWLNYDEGMKNLNKLKSTTKGKKHLAVCGVYTITAPNGEIYVGSSVDCWQRWCDHRHHLRQRTHGSLNLQAVADLYGLSNLVFEVVEEVTKARRHQARRAWFCQLKAEGRAIVNKDPAAMFVLSNKMMRKPDKLRSTFRNKSNAVCGIYTITAPGGEVHVGASTDCYKTWSNHNSALRLQCGSSRLQAVADFYGLTNLVFEVVEEVGENDLFVAEQRWIDILKKSGRVPLHLLKAGEIPFYNKIIHSGRMPRGVRGTHSKTGETIEFASACEAERSGFKQEMISLCCRGKRNFHHGYRWEFVDQANLPTCSASSPNLSSK